MGEISMTTSLALEGKVAIVTGGASGIGEATARLFVSQGARMVVIADIQDPLGRTVAASISPTNCSYIRCDVTDEAQVQSTVESTVRAYGHLDVMFSNAGIVNVDQTILNLDFSKMDRLFAINVRGMAACVKHAARAMISGGVKGSIVCTGSLSSSKGFDGTDQDYCMSKHAVLGLVRCASCELAKHGIRVNCVSPGWVDTPMLTPFLGIKENDATHDMMLMKTNHVADAVLFLASDQSAFVTGQDLILDALLQSA